MEVEIHVLGSVPVLRGLSLKELKFDLYAMNPWRFWLLPPYLRPDRTPVGRELEQTMRLLSTAEATVVLVVHAFIFCKIFNPKIHSLECQAAANRAATCRLWTGTRRDNFWILFHRMIDPEGWLHHLENMQ